MAWIAFRSVHKPVAASIIEALTVGSAISIALQLSLNIFTTTVGWGQIPWIATFLISIALSAPFLWLNPVDQLVIANSKSSYLAIAVTLPLFLVTKIVEIYRSPTLDQVFFDRIHPDMYLLEAMGNAIARFGPGESGLAIGQSFRYHWFAYAWTSWFSDQIEAGPLIVLVRVAPILAVLLLIGIASALTTHFFKQIWAPAVVSVSLLIGTSIDYYTGKAINFMSSSHTIGAIWLLLLILLISVAWNEPNWKQSIPLILLLSATTMGSKLSHGAVLVAGIALLFLVKSYVIRRIDIHYLLLLVLTLVPVAVVYLVYQSGQPSGGGLGNSGTLLTLDGTSALYGLLVAVGITLAARLIRWLGLAYALTNKETRSWDITWLAVGAVSLSVLAAPILRSDGGTEQWFLESANIIALPVTALAVIWFFTQQLKSNKQKTLQPMIFLTLASVFIALIFMTIYKSPINDQRPYISYLVTLVAIAIVSTVSMRILKGRGTRAEIFTGTAATIGLLLSLLVSTFMTFADIREGALTAERPPIYFTWGKDEVFESGDQQLKAAAYEAAMWLRENADPETEVLQMNFPTQSWMGTLSNLRLVNSFPEILDKWSIKNTDAVQEAFSSSDLLTLTLENSDGQLKLTCGPEERPIAVWDYTSETNESQPPIASTWKAICNK